MVIPVLDELVLMNLPACWRGDAGGRLEYYGRVIQLL